MSRNLLHKSKLEAFKAWLVEQDIPFRPGKGAWQELQVRLPNSTVYAAVYSRADMPEHLSVDRRLDSLVARFCREEYPNRSATGNNPRTNPRGCPKVSKLVEALEEISDPIRFMQERLEEGEQLNGMVAVQLAEDAEYLSDIAKAALAAYRKEGEA